MKQYFDYSKEQWGRFCEIDGYFAGRECAKVEPAGIEPVLGELSGVRAVMWDIYGTLMAMDVGDLESSTEQQEPLRSAAGVTADYFGWGDVLAEADPAATGAETLAQWYLDEIEQSHERSKAAGVAYPEVVIEENWGRILTRLKEYGMDGLRMRRGDGRVERIEDAKEAALTAAYFFDQALQQSSLYDGAGEALMRLKRAGMPQGIISNAQFYTPMHMRRLLRGELGDERLELGECFDEGLVYFSYELGCSKPNPLAFNRANGVFAERGMAAGEVVYIGNDMLNDVWGAQQAGWRTILFAGDERQTRLREGDERCAVTKPDAVVKTFNEILEVLGQK